MGMLSSHRGMGSGAHGKANGALGRVLLFKRMAT